MTPRNELLMTGLGPPDWATITFLGMTGILPGLFVGAHPHTDAALW
jgi:hypothetical protein